LIVRKSVLTRLMCRSTALISLLLVGVFAAGLIAPIAPVKAPTDVILWLVSTNDPGPGYYGGYHDIVPLLQTEFEKIGIDLRWENSYDAFTWEDVVWDITWDRNGTYDGDPSSHTYGEDGWDLALFEWWENPTSYIWGDELVYSWGTPPTGWNIMSWNDTKADYFWQMAATTLDTTTHNKWMWKWQEEAMHNPPTIPIYYAEQMTARASYLDGWDDVAWLYDLSQLDINETKFNEVAPTTPYDRKSVGSDTVIWAAAEPVWVMYPLGTLTYSEETLNVLKGGMLYRTSRENMAFPPSGDFTVIPTLAADFPSWYQLPDPDGRWVARVPIRSGITWSDGVEFNATDVAYSYNSVLNPACKSQAYGDYSFLLDTVQVVDRYTVDFIYALGMGPDYDFAGYQAHGWALSMLPWHQIGPDYVTNWKSQPYNFDPVPVSRGGDGLEVLGPYVPTAFTSEVAVEFEKRTEYVDALGWSDTIPNRFIMKFIPTAETRFIALQNLEADFIEYPTAPLADWQNMQGWATHRVYSYFYPAAHSLWIQHTNTILSNRYVRLALAYAIPYDTIFNNILPGWGVLNAYRGKTMMVLPNHESFHPTLGNYEYNITKAQQYMDMWRNSQVGATPSLGPLGDHDFSGFVEMPDYPIWVNNLGKYTYEFPWWPSNNIDPDNDNSGRALLPDITYWGMHVGDRYPYSGAW